MGRSRQVVVAVLTAAALLGAGIGVAIASLTSSSPAPVSGGPEIMRSSPADPGTTLSATAPPFTLTDERGDRVSLRSFRGKVVILAFNDPVCTTICPLTTTAMVEAKRLLGPAGSQVQLLGISANPRATAVKWVRDYSRLHGMQHQWHFLTGSLPQLKRVWRDYGIAAQVINDEIDHTPALYVIDPRGRERKLYLTPMAYTGIGRQASALAREVSLLLPGHPAMQSPRTSRPVAVTPPTKTVDLPRAGGGTVRLGPGPAPRLYLFFDTWVSETSNLRTQLQALDRYQALARARGLPLLTAVDEGSVEPSPAALPRLLGTLRQPLSFPVAVDSTGQVADGYRVGDEPWLALVSGKGRFLWYYSVSALGWPTTEALVTHVRAALAHAVNSHGPATGAGSAS